MNAEEYRQALDAITAGVLRAVAGLLRSLGGRPLTDRQFDAIVSAVYPAMEAARRRAYYAAQEFYLTEAPEGAEPPQVPQPHYDRQALEQALRRTVRQRLDKLADGGGQPVEQAQRLRVVDTAAAAGASAAARHVEMAARDTIVATTRADRRALGWARAGTGRENCAFCTMLISRGPVYKSARQAGANADDRAAMDAAEADSMLGLMTQWHDGCDCIAVPVFDEFDWPGRDQYEAAEQLWMDTTSSVYGAAKLAAFRRAVEGTAA